MSPHQTRWTVLAAARFVLACVVLVGHLSLFGPVGHAWTRFGIFLNQGSAVYGFLVISGYSIAASLEREQRHFYRRRFWRIAPTYAVSLAMAVALAGFIHHGISAPNGFTFVPVTPLEIIAACLMLQSFIATTISTDGQLWTIAVEWWEYMLAPLYERLPTGVMIVIIGASMVAYHQWPGPAHPNDTTGGRMFAVLTWYWLLGFVYHRYRRTPLGFCLLVLPLLFAMAVEWVGLAAQIGVAAVMLCEDVPVPKIIIAPLEWLGELSYPLYAVHIPVLVLALLIGVTSPFLVLIASLVTAVIVLHAVDLPLRKWGSVTKR